VKPIAKTLQIPDFAITTQNVALRDNKKATVVSGFYPKNQNLSDSA